MNNQACENPEQWLKLFGLKSFRKGQDDVVESILGGNDTLCIMPTGGGKSLCYQLPTMAVEGLTIVVSPLIALMKDQVDALLELDIPATLINSSISAEVQMQRIDGMRNGKYKFVYIAPERLRSSSFMRAIQQSNIRLLAIDEAHCISQWGHDFRPDYARLGKFRQRLGEPQTIALTATATELVREDICRVLELKEPSVFISGFARDNLSLQVESVSSHTTRDHQLVDFLRKHEGNGIIYASTRKNCEQVVDLLKEEIDRPVEFYHAGLTPELRRSVQDKFMSGDIPIVVATNAFGMGIDKSDLRFVVHYNLPGSIEAYYQEAGRAGRDGLESECLMFFSYQDRVIQEFFIENSYPSRSVVQEVYEYLQQCPGDPIEMTLLEVKEALGLSTGSEAISTCENLLEKAGALERLDSKQNMAAIKIDSTLPSIVDYLPRDAKSQRKVLRALEKRIGSLQGERVFFKPQTLAKELDMKWDAVSRAIRQLCKLEAVDFVPPFRGRAIHLLHPKKKFSDFEIDFSELERRKKAELHKLESMIRLASTNRCRQMEILEYFGDPETRKCGKCDNCGGSGGGELLTLGKQQHDACLYAAQVALSGAARTHGRIGKTLIAQMLTGSTAKKLKGLALHRLSTFGLLKGLRQTDVVALIDWLLDMGYMKQIETTKFRPIIQITQRGQRLMGGIAEFDSVLQLAAPLALRIAGVCRGQQPYRKPAEDPDSSDAQGPADDTTEVPAEMDANEPTDEVLSLQEPQELLQPQQPLETSAESVDEAESVDDQPPPSDSADVLAQGKADRADPEKSGFEPQLRFDAPDAMRPSYYWTWKLLDDGYNVSQVEQIRQIDSQSIEEHLQLASENHLESRAEWLLTTSQIKRLSQYTTENATLAKAALISRLPDELQTHQLLYFLNCRS